MKNLKRARQEGVDHKADLGKEQYRGYVISSDEGVGKVRYADLSPETFFDDFVAPRKPVLMEGCLAESEGWRGGQWTNQYLRAKAGDADVKVEFRGGAGERFGQGLERAMKFGDFLGELERRNDLLYLTTQELSLDPNGRPGIMSAPLDRLRGDYPLRPRLAGALIPQNVNLWMGYTKPKEGGSSSGLHHDFHDNLYVLLRGKKTFRLFSPGDAHRMYLQGEVVKVHPNGRINYRGKDTLPDGSDPLAETAARAADLVDSAAKKAEEIAVAAAAAAAVAAADPDSGSAARQEDGAGLAAESRKSEEEVAAAQAALERGESGAAERLAAAEEELERALEAVLDAECAGGAGFGDGDSCDSSSDSDGGPGFFDGINDNPSEEAFLAASAKKANGARASSPPGGPGPGDDGDGAAGDGDSGDGSSSDGDVGVSDLGRDGGADDAGSQAGESAGGAGGGDGQSNGRSSSNSSSSENIRNGSGAAAAGDGRSAKKKKVEGAAHGKGAPPSNFSRVDPSLPRAELAERFPLFLEAKSCTVEVHAGQMLYLPAGWFHEVSSVASENGHMAFNYWFHPPDSLSSASEPYKSSFWQRDWEAREREGEV